MPQRALRPCAYPCCPVLVTTGYCDKHKRVSIYDKQRGSAASRGYDYKWQQFRQSYLKHNPLCIDCMKVSRVEPATDIHHKKKLRNGGSKYNKDNLMALCHECHSIRTQRGE